MADLVDYLAGIQCGCVRQDAVGIVDRETLVCTLQAYGFGRGTVPSDWETYYATDELADFVLTYAERDRPAA